MSPPHPNTVAPIRKILARYSGVAEDAIDLDSELGAGGLGLDSLDRIEVAIAVGSTFGFDIPDAHVDWVELSTLGGLATYIDGRIGTFGRYVIGRDAAGLVYGDSPNVFAAAMAYFQPNPDHTAPDGMRRSIHRSHRGEGFNHVD